jgi:hypothetical protein
MHRNAGDRPKMRRKAVMFNTVLVLITLVACVCFDCEGEDYGASRQSGWRHRRLVGVASAEAQEQRRLRAFAQLEQVEPAGQGEPAEEVEPAAGQHEPAHEEHHESEDEWEDQGHDFDFDGGEASEASSEDDEDDPDPYLEALRETVAGMCQGEIPYQHTLPMPELYACLTRLCNKP